jgi:hypothetical protein
MTSALTQNVPIPTHSLLSGERTPLIGSLAMGAEVEIRKRSRPPGLGFGTSVPASSSTIDSAMLRQQSAPPALESDFNST